MPEGGYAGSAKKFVSLWVIALGGAGLAIAVLGRYGAHLVAFGFLYAALATSWSWLRACGLFSFGQAAFFGVGALTQAWLVSVAGFSPWTALAVSALLGAAAALPLIPALRLRPASFGLATLAYSVFLKGLAGNLPAWGMEGFLLPPSPGFDGAEPPIVATAIGLALGLGAFYQLFLHSPAGRAASAIRQAPETTLSLGIDLVGARWLPLTLSGAATAAAGALYAHLVGSVETVVVFSPIFSVVPLVLGMLGGALHPLGGLLGMLAIFPADELLLRPMMPHAHTLAYGIALVGLLLVKPDGFLGAPTPWGHGIASARRRATRIPFALDVRGLSVRRGGAEALRDVSFSLQPGRILRVLGPNGAGKSTLLLAISGRLEAAGGSILFGEAPAPRGAAARARCGLAWTLQAPRPFPEWSVRENVAISAERTGNLGAVSDLLDELELTELADRPAGQLSVGEGKRLQLARVLALRPAVLLLDEPMAGLTPEAATRVSGLIGRTRDEGVAIVWVEHGPAHDELADQLLVLEGGRVSFLGAPSDLPCRTGSSAS